MRSFRSIFLFAATALVAFTSASPVPETTNIKGVQTLETILGSAKTQLSAVQAQVDQIATAGETITADTVRPQIDAVNDILTQTLASVKPLTREAFLSPGNITTLVQQLASFINTIANVVQSIISAVGGGVNGQSVTNTAAATIGVSLGEILVVILTLVGGILPPLIPLLKGVIPTLLALGLGPILGIRI